MEIQPLNADADIYGLIGLSGQRYQRAKKTEEAIHTIGEWNLQNDKKLEALELLMIEKVDSDVAIDALVKCIAILSNSPSSWLFNRTKQDVFQCFKVRNTAIKALEKIGAKAVRIVPTLAHRLQRLGLNSDREYDSYFDNIPLRLYDSSYEECLTSAIEKICEASALQLQKT